MRTAPPRTRRTLAAGALAVAAVLAGCVAPSASPTPTPSSAEASETVDPSTPAPAASTAAPDPEPEPAAPPAQTGITITSGGSDFGSMLFDGSRQAIYIWELETSPEARCYDDCAQAWPPVLTDGNPVATGDVSAAMLGTTPRSDGTTQVTYNGHPLYYYADEAPGEVRCHDVSTHGGLWWVVQPNGNRAA